MTRIKNTVVLITLLLASAAYAQPIRLSIQSGIGTYRMDGLKEMNVEAFNDLPFKARMISNYPAYFYYKPGVGFSFDRVNIGVQASFNSTGSRISSKDYSGEYLFDTRINSFAPGLCGEFQLLSLFSKYGVSLTSEGGAIFSWFTLNEQMTLNQEPSRVTDYDFKSTNYFVESGLKVETSLLSFLNLGLNAGYLVQFGKQKLGSDIDGATNMRPDWGGVRVGMSLVVVVAE